MIALLRFAVARHPEDAALDELIAELSLESEVAARWWETHDVAQKRHGMKRSDAERLEQLSALGRAPA